MPSLLRKQSCKKSHDQIWQDVIDSKNSKKIKHALKQGIMPRYLNTVLLIQHADENVNKSLMEVVIDNNVVREDLFYFDLADHFLKKGARLPKLFLERSAFLTTSDYFIHLIQCPHDLYIALRSNPGIYKMRCEKGKTLLHYAAQVAMKMSAEIAFLSCYLLFSARFDFNAKDKQGNTPLHIAAHYGVMNEECLSDFINKSCELGADLSIINNQDQTMVSIFKQQIEKLNKNLDGVTDTCQKILLQQKLEVLKKLQDILVEHPKKHTNLGH